MATKLVIPTEGPCAGHPCDNCWTCRHGRCCRRDNPDYKLPELGDWDGPVYGELGVLADDGQKVECHICGEWFDMLGNHIRLHDVTPDEYRSIFGLGKTFGLAGPAYKTMMRTIMRSEPGRIARMSAMGKAFTSTLTLEQRSGFVDRTRRLQARKVASERTKQWFSDHPAAFSRLSPDDILSIRSISPRPSSKAEFSALAEQYGVSTQTIQRVIYRKLAPTLVPDVVVAEPEKRSYAKLFPSDIVDIQLRIKAGDKQRDIARAFGISQGRISHIAMQMNHSSEVAA